MPLTQKELDRKTPEELLILIMEEASEVIKAASKCHRFGWDLKYGRHTNNELLISEKLQLDAVLKTYFLKTRRGDT